MVEPIRKLIKSAAKSIDQHNETMMADYHLTRMQSAVLDFLAGQKNHQANQHVLEKEWNIRRSTTTVMVQRLEKRGLVTRKPDPQDKRQKIVILTKKAEELVPGIKNVIKEEDLDLQRKFSSEDLDTVRKILKYICEKG